MATTLPSPQELQNLKRADLQKICKDLNIKANLRTDQLVELLTKELSNRGESSQQAKMSSVPTAASAQAEARKPTRTLRRSLSQPVLVPSLEGHSRTNSKESIQQTRPLDRRQPIVHSLTRKPSVKDGKENGLGPTLGTRGVKGSMGPPGGVAATGQVSKGIAGKIAVFGRAIGANTKPLPDASGLKIFNTESVTSRKPSVPRPPPPKPALTAMTFVEPAAPQAQPKPSSPPVVVPSIESRLAALESAHANLLATTTILQKNLDTAQASLDATRLELKACETRLSHKDGEIKRLRGEIEDSRMLAEGQAAANEELRQTIAQLSERIGELEDGAKESAEETSALRAKTVELESSNARMTELESAVASLTQQMAQQAMAPPRDRPVQRSQMLVPGQRTDASGSPLVTYQPHVYMDLEYPPTPSSRRRNHLWAAEFGQDALANYNGFGRQSLDNSPRF